MLLKNNKNFPIATFFGVFFTKIKQTVKNGPKTTEQLRKNI